MAPIKGCSLCSFDLIDMNEAEYFGNIIIVERPSNYVISNIIEDYSRGNITIANLSKQYNLTAKMVWDIVQEVLPDKTRLIEPIVIVLKSKV